MEIKFGMIKKLPKRKDVKTESPIEDIVLREFHLLGYYPVPQFKVGPYRIDLAFPEKLIAIECDGKEWHSSDEQIERDRIRDEYLKKNGWRVIRITGGNIYRSADSIIGFLVGKKEWREWNRLKEPEIEIDYENDPLDLIEDKEEMLRFQQEELLDDNKKLSSIGKILKERYKRVEEILL